MNLSNIELYYTQPLSIEGSFLTVSGEEFLHITRVMRHSSGDELYITNGTGKIFKTVITDVSNGSLSAQILDTYAYENKLKNIFFCIPKIKSPDRFEFALEKCTELGITNLIIFESDRSPKKNEKTERWNKILLSAMKQSLRSQLPSLVSVKSFNELFKLEGEKLILEQNSQNQVSSLKLEADKNYFFIFGPEGGLTQSEIEMVREPFRFKLTDNRLRTETAVVTCAALLNQIC